MKQLTRKTLGVLLALVMVLAPLPGLTVTAQAGELLSYYVCGSMSGWMISSDYLMTYDASTNEMYIKGVALQKDCEFKIASSGDGQDVKSWFPEGMENAYVVPEDGVYDIRFRYDGQGGPEWHEGCILVTPAVTDEPAAPLFGTYTLTIPSALNITAPGWNATAGITASGELPQGKTLSVTASSDGEFALVNNLNSEKKIPYALAAAADATPTDVWTFDSVTAEAQTLPMGVIVEDYTDMPAGTYEDTVTFTVKVVDAASALQTVTISFGQGSQATLYYANGETWKEAIIKHSENSDWKFSPEDSGNAVYYQENYQLYIADGEYTATDVKPGDAVNGEAQYMLFTGQGT